MIRETERLVLRPFRESDTVAFHAYRNDPEVARYQSWDVPYSGEQAQAFVAWAVQARADAVGEWYQTAIEQKDSGELIGDVGFLVRQDDPRQAKIGYTLAREHQGNGFASEAVQEVLRYLFEERNLHRVTAECDTENTASFRLLERLRFRREAHFIESDFYKGRYASEYHYALLRREFSEADRSGLLR
ncbi:MAG: GNAT family protein [Armatimonadaceae bacterium]